MFCPNEWAGVDGKNNSFSISKSGHKVMLKSWIFQLIFACLHVFSGKWLRKFKLNKFNFIIHW
ncbi:MAG: hypothetical protein ACJAT4_001736 [Granulosicoccus sp.]|jgi:hypothetical protein